MARSFGTTSDYLQSPINSALSFNTDICYFAVIYITTASSTNGVAQCIATYGSGLYIGSGNDMVFNKTGVVNVTAPIGVRMATGRWFAISAYGTTGGDCKFKHYDYQNATLATGTTTDTGSIIAPDSGSVRVEWGQLRSFSYPFLGRIDRVLFAQMDPTDAEFMEFAMGRVPIRASLNHVYFNGSSPEPDWSGNATHLTVNGSTQVDGAPVPHLVFAQRGWRGAIAAAGGGGGGLPIPVAMHNYRRRRAA